MKTLTPRREKFAQCMADGMTAADAYRAAFTVKTMNEKTLWSTASRIYNLPAVAARVQELRSFIDKGTEQLFSITKAAAAAMVLEDAVRVVQADPSDLITHRCLNCRFCHGTNNAYRWRDEEEFWTATADAAEAQDKWDATPERERRGKRPKLPTDEGGYGFRTIAPPMPNCPKCEGEGIVDVRVADVQTLTGPARSLYNGIKVKKDGSIEVLMRSKDAARDLLGKYAGVVVDQVKHSGVVGLTPIPLSEEVRAAVLKAIENDI